MSILTYGFRFMRDGINILTRSRVTKVEDGMLTYVKGKDNPVEHKIPFGMCIWTTGVGMQPFTETVAQQLDAQMHSRALMVDQHLRVKGAFQGSHPEHGDVFALGDCSAVEIPPLVNRLLDLYKTADANGNGSLSLDEFTKFAEQLKRDIPQTEVFLHKLTKVFAEYDADGNGNLSFEEFEKMVRDLAMKLKTYPATAQVAQQQGAYVAGFLNWQAMNDDSAQQTFRPFKYHHFGSLAYLGSATAALDFGDGLTMSDGLFGLGRLATFWVWRSVYLSEVVSLRQRVRLANDWMCASAFGREVSRFT
jgi:NADH dehydrogenase